MEARITRAVLLAAVLLVSMGASHRTANFIVTTQDPRLAVQIGQTAEQWRRELAVSWLGKAMPDWAQPCPMTVQVGPTLGAGGATTFVFDRGEVFGWRMTIQGSHERVLDSVLPHEITHMIFASHFRRPLPRWADEGGATSVEHESEKAKHRRMLIQFLRTNRGIAFNRMFAMTEYPRDIMPLYAQGYAVAEFLIQQGGRRKYLDFLADGMADDHWSAAVKKHYGIEDLGVLQNTWVAWVRDGYPPLSPPKEPEKAPQLLLAAGGKPARPAPNLIHHIRAEGQQAGQAAASAAYASDSAPYRPGSIALVPALKSPSVKLAETAGPMVPIPAMAVSPPGLAAKSLPADGWHAAGAAPPAALAAARDSAAPGPNAAGPIESQVTRPQPIEKSRQIILEYQRSQPAK
jgi:hypothetical protein